MSRTAIVVSMSALLIVVSGCSGPTETPAPGKVTAAASTALVPLVGAFEEITVPSAPGSGQPHVAVAPDGRFLASWTEPDGEQHAVRMSRLDGGTWSEPSTISARSDFFVNWADFPSIAASGSALYAHWLQRSAPGTYNYDVVMSISTDGAASWGRPFVVHDDGIMAEHGFVSMLPLPDNRVGITWLDGREMGAGHGEGHGDMSLRYAVVSPDGGITDGALLDPRTCECCTTTITATPNGPFVAWRDRSDDEVRDISFARLSGGSWTAPSSVHDDGWQIEGCPVNGPQSDSRGNRVVVAWFTGAGETGTVNAAFSDDAGVAFGAPAVLSSGEGVVGYIDVVFVSDDRAFVVWMEDRADRLDLVGREVTAAGETSEPMVIASTSRGRTGFPRMAESDGEILLAWNEKGDSPKIRMARAMTTR